MLHSRASLYLSASNFLYAHLIYFRFLCKLFTLLLLFITKDMYILLRPRSDTSRTRAS